MSFFRRLFNRQVPTKQMTSPSTTPMAFYIGGDGRMQAIKQDGILYHANAYTHVGLGYLFQNQEQYAKAAISSVWAANCINLRADTMARLDWHVRYKATKEIIEGHPFTVALENSKQNIIRLLEKRLLTYGEVFILPQKNNYNFFSAFFCLNNLSMTVDTSLGYIKEFRYNPPGLGHVYRFMPEELIFIHTDNDFDDYRGLSKFEHVLLEINIDRDISRTTAAFYQNDARPGILLLPERELTPQQGEEFIDYWNARFKGPENAGRPAIIPQVIREVVDFQRAPSLDDVELRESVRRETCAAFKVPLSMAGAWDDATYQSLPEQRQAFYEETIIPAAEGHARDLSKFALPYFDSSRDIEVYFDATKILSLVENVAEKVDVATRKLSSGAYTINEVRQSLDDDPIKGGDIFIMQSGWIPVSVSQLPSYEAPNTQTIPDNPPPALPSPQDNQPNQDNQNAPVQSMPTPPTRSDHQHDIEEPSEPIAVKTIHDEALKELQQWRKWVANGNAQKRDFSTYMIRDEIAGLLQGVIKANDKDAIKAAFENAEQLIAIKEINAVRSNFELEIKRLIDGARLGSLKRVNFTNRLLSTIREFTARAYRAGLTDGGVITPPTAYLETEDAAIYMSMLEEQLRYAAPLSEQVYQKGLSDKEALLKPRQWWAKTGLPFYDAGLLSANRNEMIEIVGVIDEHSCPTCRALVGQRHRRKTIHNAGLMPPYGTAIICGEGGHCKHRAQHANGRPRGNLSAVPRR